MNPLTVLQSVDFDWVMRLSEVWNDAAWDVPDLHAGVRREFVDKLEAMRDESRADSPLGWVIVGGGGAGKTHLLGVFRREAMRRKAAFVLVDMTGVRDFWETVLQGYIDSLQQPYGGVESQHQWLLRNVIERLGPKQPVTAILSHLSRRNTTDLVGDINKILRALSNLDRQQTLTYQNVVRALVCLNSEDFAVSSLGMAWLQGQEIEPADKQALGFSVAREDFLKIIQGLSWLMSLSGPTILAFDALDPIVIQHHLKRGEAGTEEESTAQAIIAAISAGFVALPDSTRRTLAVVSCVESTWEILRESLLRPAVDRFAGPRKLDAVKAATVAEALIRDRLAPVFEKTGFKAPYPTWPFLPEAFADLARDTPREILQKCASHRQRCLDAGEVRELNSFASDPRPLVGTGIEDKLKTLDERFAAAKAEADPSYLLEEKHEDIRLAPLLQTALQCLVHERNLPESVDAVVEFEFSGGKTTRPLHARLRLIFHDENSREEHFCIRALELTNANAYQARLKAAVTQSGIDRSLRFRHLTVVRTRPIPSGAVTQKLTQQFQSARGCFHHLSDEELRVLAAIHRLKQEGDPDFERWLQARQSISKLPLVRTAVPSPLLLGSDEPTKPGEPPSPPAPPALREFPLGLRLLAGKTGDPLAVPVRLLEKHTAVLAGAGSGKTVLLRRLIEEAACLHIPAIVIDAANDLATLDERWPTRPLEWEDQDERKAEAYHRESEVILWTPGKESGNPLAFEPLPDLAAVAGEEEELEAAVAMVRETLVPIAAPGASAAARSKQGILSKALRYFAKHGGGNLPELIGLLDDLPPEAGLGVVNELRLAKQMADALKVAKETNPLLRSAGTPLDPAVLFGDDHRSSQVRISVINFVGLQGLEAQRHFLNQLAMTLFSWIKKHPDPGRRPLRGLLVIDEAKDFVPSQKHSVCKESLIRLAAQARKYHLGLVFATQNPKDIDNKVIANCSTHYYGKLNSPAAIETVRELIVAKGGSGTDIPRLPRGQFYVHNADAGLTAPVKVKIPMCLSRHPDHPLEEVRILQKAAASRLRDKTDLPAVSNARTKAA